MGRNHVTDHSDGTRWNDVCTDSQKSRILTQLDEALRSGSAREALILTEGDDPGRDLHVNIAPLGNAEAIVFLRDVSKLRKAEQDEVKQRSRELALETKVEELAKLSTPMIPLREGVLVVPVVGDLDQRGAQRLRESLLDTVVAKRADVVSLGLSFHDVRVVRSLQSAIEWALNQ